MLTIHPSGCPHLDIHGCNTCQVGDIQHPQYRMVTRWNSKSANAALAAKTVRFLRPGDVVKTATSHSILLDKMERTRYRRPSAARLLVTCRQFWEYLLTHRDGRLVFIAAA